MRKKISNRKKRIKTIMINRLSFLDKRYILLIGDALSEMTNIENECVDLICVDLPYGITHNKWDIIIPFDQMWLQFRRVLKENGAIVLTATQPFSSMLVMSNLEMFRYDLVWEKTISSGQLNVKRQPLRNHESILVFYRKQPTYNEQKTAGTPYSIKRDADYQDGNYNKQKPSELNNDGYRHAKSVIKISNPRIKGGHPTQKPLALMEYLIKVFSNENDIVLDCCMGSGTTGVASILNNRRFIGIEVDKKYNQIAEQRITESEKHDHIVWSVINGNNVK